MDYVRRWVVAPRKDASDSPVIKAERGTTLYLAYGSNLSIEAFRKARGIQPLSELNVQVPSLRLTFDLPGIPYAEPCFANTARAKADANIPEAEANEKMQNLGPKSPYHKDRWTKGLVGVVYEVTLKDFAHIIATEGGGSSYKDIEVDCYPFATQDPSVPVPENPTLRPFKAHTLYAAANTHPKEGRRAHRPDPSYAQPSPRYLKLLTDGAAELRLPNEYQDYLRSVRPYVISTDRQRIGQYIFLSIWMPFIILIFALGRRFHDKDGRMPPWVQKLSVAVFNASWTCYDLVFKRTFGDGERSIENGGIDPSGSRIHGEEPLAEKLPDINVDRAVDSPP
ncbi:hypothetical protein K470DRAFT_281724 [Piedraia hortae CBS 480.64]|uniref:gamma-glutamylcyclotransferase n=1 Tax=Piedraia hortae CBS 480.64 TaxID=1314780 RepID=A0A6A7C114_9PEZI|nr:hypothetical protein K470DRAFT_281724 [Piedraia hortae CBS 480.64]